VPLFLLVLGILVWTFWPASPETLYERGAALMQSKDPADWDRAWREFLEPLELNHPDHPHKAEVEKFRQQIEAHAHRLSEGQRLYLIGEKMQQERRWAQARLQWQQIVDVFKDVESEKEWVRRAQQGIAEVDKMAADQQRWAPVRAALKQAATLRDQGQRPAAEAIWNGIEALYLDDPHASAILQEVAAARKQ
jgi:hypothetical protein